MSLCRHLTACTPSTAQELSRNTLMVHHVFLLTFSMPCELISTTLENGCALTCEEEGVVCIPGWMLLRLEQGIKIPEAAQCATYP